MPTGYTASVADGTVKDFPTFALQCARAFGATIMQRDDPMSEPPKLQEPSQYHAKALAEAEAMQVELREMTEAEAWRRAEDEHTQKVAEYERIVANKRETKRRYETMLAEVRAWTPPTPAHSELREFMEKQLVESLDFDCCFEPKRPVARTGSQWLAEKRQAVAHDIGYHRQHHAEEVERTNGRNAWIQALYDSLKLTVAL